MTTPLATFGEGAECPPIRVLPSAGDGGFGEVAATAAEAGLAAAGAEEPGAGFGDTEAGFAAARAEAGAGFAAETGAGAGFDVADAEAGGGAGFAAETEAGAGAAGAGFAVAGAEAGAGAGAGFAGADADAEAEAGFPGAGAEAGAGAGGFPTAEEGDDGTKAGGFGTGGAGAGFVATEAGRAPAGFAGAGAGTPGEPSMGSVITGGGFGAPGDDGEGGRGGGFGIALTGVAGRASGSSTSKMLLVRGDAMDLAAAVLGTGAREAAAADGPDPAGLATGAGFGAAVGGFGGAAATAGLGAAASDDGLAGGSTEEADAAPPGRSSSSQPESRSSVSGVFCSLMLRPRRGSRVTRTDECSGKLVRPGGFDRADRTALRPKKHARIARFPHSLARPLPPDYIENAFMHVTMVKKRLTGGEACRKCVQAEELFKRRGLWSRIDEVVWADEDDPASPGMVLGAKHRVEIAPFFIVREHDGKEIVFESALKLIKERFSDEPVTAATTPVDANVEHVATELERAHPREILKWGLSLFGARLGIAFSGAEDVVLVHLASELGLPFSVFCLDTGRLHPETYRFIDTVRRTYGIEIRMMSPDAPALEAFVRKKGLFSFYEDGHEECCGIRKVAPLRRALSDLSAWASGQRRDQSPATRGAIPVVEYDRTFTGAEGRLVKLNPLAAWTSADTWAFIRDNRIPFNPLHERGMISIGCEPCTRAILPGEHERAGRWWWEESTKKECGLHIANTRPPR